MKIYTTDSEIYSLEEVVSVSTALYGTNLNYPALILNYKDGTFKRIMFNTMEQKEAAFKEITDILKMGDSDSLKPNSTYVVEFNGNFTIPEISKHIEWLNELAGNGIKFVPSTRMVKIVKGD